MNKIIKVDTSNINLLQDFINNLGGASNTFRYFEKRNIHVIKNHLLTILLECNNKVIGYGHLDKENDKVWLGIAVLPDYKGMGYGKIIMSNLINFAKNIKLKNIYLSVDKNNTPAISLYEKFNFALFETTQNTLFYILIL